MTTDKIKRKLTAILSADVKGYSRLMGEDEVGTIRTLTAYKEAMAGFIQKHRGRVVGTAGDSVLAEFASVVDAVQCAVEIQKELKSRNADLPENRRMEFRIGTHRILGFMSLMYKRDYDKAVAELERAVALEPNSAEAYGLLAQHLTWAGRLEEAIPFYKKGSPSQPYTSTSLVIYYGRCLSHDGSI